VTVTLADTVGPLELRPPANAHPDDGDGGNTTLWGSGNGSCTVLNRQVPGTCAWAAIKLAGQGWVNATVSVAGSHVVLTAPGTGVVVGTAYGWGAIPMLTVYDAKSSLPVLPWNSTWNYTAATTGTAAAAGATAV
jgi:hypothetical protein